MFAILGGVAALVVIAIIAGFMIFKPGGGNPTGPTGTNGTSAPPSPAAAKYASDAVSGYLKALAAGDAATALSYAQVDPADKTFLTNDVLKATQAKGAITDINVPEVTGDSAYSVAATYKIGTRSVSDEIRVIKVGDSWKLREVTEEVDFGYARAETLPMLIGGIELKQDKVELFPGAYEVTTGVENISYGTKNVVTVEAPGKYTSTVDLQPTLTSAGQAAFIKAARAKLASCLKQKALRPTGCGFGLNAPTGVKINLSTLSWTVDSKGDPFASVRPRLDYEDPAIGKGSPFISIKGRAKGTNGTSYVGTTYITGMSADLTKDTISVTFEN